jgi:hypothetical protein
VEVQVLSRAHKTNEGNVLALPDFVLVSEEDLKDGLSGAKESGSRGTVA